MAKLEGKEIMELLEDYDKINGRLFGNLRQKVIRNLMKVVKAESDRKFDESSKGRK